jgi:hypothetical protein
MEMLSEKFEVRENDTVIDDAFVVRKTRFGLYTSIGLDGRKWVTGLTEEAVIYGTRFNLKAEIDGTLWEGPNVKVLGKAVVGGKL